MKVGLLIGVKSSEKEIAMKSARNIISALRAKNYELAEIPIDENVVENIKKEKIDVAIISAHGVYGEDGTIQGLLELLGIPYVGSGVLASALALNKLMAKKIFTFHNIPTPKWIELSKKALEEKDLIEIKKELENLKMPLIIKPANQGSTIGLSVVKQEEDLLKGIEYALQYDSQIVIEEFIKGKEITAGIYDVEKPICLPLIEIIPKTGFYDYTTKYTPGLSEHIIPARLPEDIYKKAQELGILAHQALGCRHLSRVDMIVEENTQNIYILEINTIPGMTEVSLYPEAAKAFGIDFPDIIDNFIKATLKSI
ncbi:MAG TPA: D-alanine--D-alanine ligase [Dictyoglomaceae bacterium]|nr:D-alanine--D-alanine ligase [Dictyoglomaceae bacterium]HOL39562.1 D-alanine--D-alanine ligase [Dictyoglomaceae bacterium]HPP16427.1 D-alanine--D-alanine ligase [Dictyoglomaceae bacterium]HPU43320.1 D-alanine--D-alanine ligase [Dictyoglomaceae bacterium]